MSDLALTFSNVYTRVSDFLGMGLTPAGANLTLVKDIVYRGYRKFLMPMNLRNGRSYIWSFLKQIGSFTTSGGQWEYELPTDFDNFLWGPIFGESSNYPNPRPISQENLRLMRSVNSSSSYPLFWSLDNGRYTVELGTHYSVLLHPTPNVVLPMYYGYTMTPNKPTDDAHYFIGGALASECILECALAEAELQEDDRLDVHSKRAIDLMQTMLERDLKTAMRSVGGSGCYSISNPVLARQLRWFDAPTSVYGVDL